MNQEQLSRLLKTCVANRRPVLVQGAPGVGKSDIVTRVAQELGYDLIISHPVVSEPVDAKGLPFPSPDGNSARFLPYGELAQALTAQNPTIWFLDDLGQAPEDVQAAFMQLLLARRIGEHRLPECVTFVAATNRRQDRAGVKGLLEPVKSRFATIVELKPELGPWIGWALENDMPPHLIAYLRMRPEAFHVPTPTPDMTNSPSPRTWANVGRLLNDGLDDDLMLEVLSGSVGASYANDFVTFLRCADELPSLDDVLLYPKSAKIPKSISALYALSDALAYAATDANFGRILEYAERLVEEEKGEFVKYLVWASIKRCPDIEKSAAYALALSNKKFSNILA